LKVSASRKEEIEELVDELSEYCMRSPLRSDLIFGEWEVVYASKPQTAGGPFRSPIGRAVFPGQRATQVIAEPNICINEVSYKALGFVPGSARQEGEIEPINETTFQITFPGQVGKKAGAPGGPPTRLVEVAYLDERIRVAKALPQKEGDEGSFYVFVRVAEDDDDVDDAEEEVVVAAPTKQQKSRGRAAPVAVVADDDTDEDEEEDSKFSLPSFDFGSQMFKKSAGRATEAERSVASRGGQVAQTRGGRSRTQSGAAKAAPAAPARKSREEMAAERAAAEEERRRAREEAAEERRRAQAAVAAEREAAQARQAAARAAYQELASAATEAASDAKEAAAAYKAAEREASSLLRAASQARSIISKAVAAADDAASQLLEAQSEEVFLEKEVLADQRLVNQLEKKLRDVSAAIAPRISKK
jgi:hypothetical protein